MTNRIFTPITLLILLIMTGCASPTKMAILDDSYDISKSTNPIFLMTATLRNTYKTEYQPKLLVVYVEKAIVSGSQDRLNFTMDDKAKVESDDPDTGSTYFLRMELEPGDYVIRGLASRSSSLFIYGSFFTPIHENITADGTGVYYLGHVDATVRKREGNEFKAGSSIPLIDQSVAGASGGTFDIEISDQWEEYESLFRTKFSALAKVEIKKAVLPPFDRERAQQWWESH